MSVRVKICGLKDRAGIDAAARGGAAYVGFNFFAPSPRSVTVEQARALAVEVPFGVVKVALLVDPDDATLDSVAGGVALDMIQLHGGETPARVAEVRARTGLPVMKVKGIAGPADMEALAPYFAVADQILVDAKAPPGAVLPGGNGVTFDWGLLAGRRWPRPWMLAGGLTPGNVAAAIAATGATQVDVASGVESAPGVKDPGLIAAFLSAAGALAPPRGI